MPTSQTETITYTPRVVNGATSAGAGVTITATSSATAVATVTPASAVTTGTGPFTAGPFTVTQAGVGTATITFSDGTTSVTAPCTVASGAAGVLFSDAFPGTGTQRDLATYGGYVAIRGTLASIGVLSGGAAAQLATTDYLYPAARSTNSAIPAGAKRVHANLTSTRTADGATTAQAGVVVLGGATDGWALYVNTAGGNLRLGLTSNATAPTVVTSTVGTGASSTYIGAVDAVTATLDVTVDVLPLGNGTLRVKVWPNADGTGALVLDVVVNDEGIQTGGVGPAFINPIPATLNTSRVTSIAVRAFP